MTEFKEKAEKIAKLFYNDGTHEIVMAKAIESMLTEAYEKGLEDAAQSFVDHYTHENFKAASELLKPPRPGEK